jgi:hypothetical protein
MPPRLGQVHAALKLSPLTKDQIMMMRKSVKKGAAHAAVFAAVLGGCAGFGPQADSWVPAPVGATWEIAQRNTGSYGKDTQLKVTRGADTTWQGAPVIAMASSQGGTIIARPGDGKWIVMVGRDGKPVMSFDPPIGWEYPLKVGKTWTTRHRITTHATGNSVAYEFSCNVEDFEKVTVLAGTFDTFRIRCKTNLGTDETYWSSPGLGPFVKTRLMRDARHPAGAGTQESELVAKSF